MNSLDFYSFILFQIVDRSVLFYITFQVPFSNDLFQTKAFLFNSQFSSIFQVSRYLYFPIILHISIKVVVFHFCYLLALF